MTTDSTTTNPKTPYLVPRRRRLVPPSIVTRGNAAHVKLDARTHGALSYLKAFYAGQCGHPFVCTSAIVRLAVRRLALQITGEDQEDARWAIVEAARGADTESLEAEDLRDPEGTLRTYAEAIDAARARVKAHRLRPGFPLLPGADPWAEDFDEADDAGAPPGPR